MSLKAGLFRAAFMSTVVIVGMSVSAAGAELKSADLLSTEHLGKLENSYREQIFQELLQAANAASLPCALPRILTMSQSYIQLLQSNAYALLSLTMKDKSDETVLLEAAKGNMDLVETLLDKLDAPQSDASSCPDRLLEAKARLLATQFAHDITPEVTTFKLKLMMAIVKSKFEASKASE